MVPFSSPHPTVPSHSHWVNSSEHRWVSFGERQRINAPGMRLRRLQYPSQCPALIIELSFGRGRFELCA